jgi:hypothetical protein
MSKLLTTSKKNSVSIQVGKLGAPGIVTHLHVVPVFEGNKKQDFDRLSDSTPRTFDVTCRLANGIDSVSGINFNFDVDSGDSLIAIPEQAVHMKVETPDGQFIFYPNAERRLSTISFSCFAQSSAEAKVMFHKIVGPSLDHLAYVANSPLHIVQVTIVDVSHQIISTDVLCPYPIVSLAQGVGKVSADLAPVYAMYREAKNAVSPFYRFFCLYKILEGLLKPLQSKLHETAKRKGLTLPKLQAKVPSYSDISDDQKPYVGKSITRFFEEFLTSRFRNSLAHFISDEGIVLNVNEVDGIERYSAVVHITDLCCREVIAHIEQCIDVLDRGAV